MPDDECGEFRGKSQSVRMVTYDNMCRAFLSPWYEKGGMHPLDETDKPVFEGRCNLGRL